MELSQLQVRHRWSCHSCRPDTDGAVTAAGHIPIELSQLQVIYRWSCHSCRPGTDGTVTAAGQAPSPMELLELQARHRWSCHSCRSNTDGAVTATGQIPMEMSPCRSDRNGSATTRVRDRWSLLTRVSYIEHFVSRRAKDERNIILKRSSLNTVHPSFSTSMCAI